MCHVRCCRVCCRANGAARCNAVALALMQADRVSPARTRTAAESTTGPLRRRCEHRHRRKWLYLRRACAVPMPRCAAGSQQRRRGDKRAAAATCSTPQSARQARCCCYMQHTLAWCSRQTSELPCVPCPLRRRCEHRHRRKWLYLRVPGRPAASMAVNAAVRRSRQSSAARLLRAVAS